MSRQRLGAKRVRQLEAIVVYARPWWGKRPPPDGCRAAKRKQRLDVYGNVW